MKKLSTLKHKIIFYVMSVAVLLAVLITLNMSIGSIVSTNTVLLENMQITTRIASQSISSNLHLLTERIYNLSSEDIFLDAAVSEEQKMARMDEMRQQVEFVLPSMIPEEKSCMGTKERPTASARPGIIHI